MSTPNSDTAYLEKLKNSSIGQKFASEMMRENFEHRQELEQKLQGIRQQRAADREEHNTAVTQAESTLDDAKAQAALAKAALAKAEREHTQAVMQRNHAASAYQAQMDRINRDLIASAPESITAFTSWCADQISEVMAEKPQTATPRSGRWSIATGRIEKQVFSDSGSLNKRLDALRQARREAEQMQLMAMPADEVEAKLNELRGSIPRSAPMEEIGAVMVSK